MPTAAPQGGGAKNTAYTMQKRLIDAKIKQFELVSNFDKIGGYRNREDITILPPGVMVLGSSNVVTNVGGRIGVVAGYTLDGQANSTITPITSSFDWTKITTGDTHIRTWGENMEVRYINPVGNVVQWVNIFDDLTIGAPVNYTSAWDPSASIWSMLFVNSGLEIYKWSGGVASYLSATANTLTISNTQTWDELGFLDPVSYTATLSFVPATNIPGTISVLTSTPIMGGINYAVGDNFTINGLPGSGATGTVAAVNSGVVTSISLTNAGQGYIANQSGGVATTATSGIGTGLVVNIASIQTVNTPATIVDNTGGFITAGLTLGDGFTVSGSVSNDRTYQVNGITANTITIGPSQVLISETNTASVTITSLPSITIDGTNYTYTGGQGTQTLTGVSPNPSTPAYPVGTAITQTVQVYGNGTTLGLPISNYSNDLIGNLDGQIFIGSLTSANIYTSALNNFLDYSYSAPRLVGEGAQSTVAGFPTAFVNEEDSLYVSVGKDLWYQSMFTQTTDTTSFDVIGSGVAVTVVYETFSWQQLKVTFQQGAQSQAATTNIANNICYISFEPQLNSFGPVKNVYQSPQITDISYPIVNDMNSYDFTDASVIYYRKYIYMSIPKEGLIRIYNMTNNDEKIQYWEAPVTYPIARFSIIDDELYGHGYAVPETYKLFTGYTFNGHPIPAAVYFSYNNYDVRDYPKVFNLFYLEGYITSNCDLVYGFNYDIDGCQTQRVFDLKGSDRALVCIPNEDASLGKASLGKRPLGGLIPQANATGLPPKFRAIKQLSELPFYEMQMWFTSLGKDFQWELIAAGPNAKPASEGNNSRQY